MNCKLCRHKEMEQVEQKEKKIRKMKKNMKVKTGGELEKPKQLTAGGYGPAGLQAWWSCHSCH